MYRVVLTRRAEKDLKALDAQTSRRVGKAILELANDPERQARKLTDPALGGFRLRVGDWRVIFDIEAKEVVVLRVGHRREIYRRRA